MLKKVGLMPCNGMSFIMSTVARDVCRTVSEVLLPGKICFIDTSRIIAGIEEEMEEMIIGQGRWLSEEDFEQGRKNCLVSWQVEENVSKYIRSEQGEPFSLIGKVCLFQNVRLNIVGVFKPEDPELNPWHLRKCVILPVRAMQKYVAGFDADPGKIRIMVKEPRRITQEAKGVSRTLKGRHRGVEDFEYRTAEWLEEIRSMLSNVSMLMSVISIISLLVGGLSIMNVMLSSISERIYEIGIRKALGAKKLQIFIQFIAETTTLSFFGGVVGAGVGTIPLFFKEAIKQSTDGAIEPTILFHHVLFVFIVIVSLGIVFGLYPAVKAAGMDPVEALRYE